MDSATVAMIFIILNIAISSVFMHRHLNEIEDMICVAHPQIEQCLEEE